MEDMAYEVCPIDGRYQDIKELVSPYFSEYAYIKYRVLVEVKWLVYLIEEEIIEFKVNKKDIESILNIYNNFNIDSYKKVKEEESITNHDVKAIEYFIVKKLKELKLERLISFVHMGLTSEDVNNTAYSLMIKDYLNNINFQKIEELLDYLKELSIKNKKVVMLGHTHGQVATPTSVGKEFKVYWYRITQELEKLKNVKIKAKFNGATGNYSALSIAYNKIDVIELSRKFIESFDLTFNPLTTQIENHDYIVTILDIIRHINNIILDLDIDMWLYISKNYYLFSNKVLMELFKVINSYLPQINRHLLFTNISCS